MMFTDPVVALIRRVGIGDLGGLDLNGCLCCEFSVRMVDVSISCGKGGDREIVVGSRSMDFENEADLLPILNEVERQASELNDGRGSFKLTITPFY